MAKAPTSNSPPGSTRPYEVSDAVQYYDAHAEEIALRYEFVASEKILSWLTDLLPSPPAIVLDVGAGTGRDAAWLAAKGFDVVAVEPSTAMRNKAELLHPSALIRWLDDALPGLDGTFRLGLSFDVILLGGVWMHVLPKDRERAFRKLVTLLKPGGVIAITLRPADPNRFMYEVPRGEIEKLARNHGAFVERETEGDDFSGRRDIRWICLAVRLPDDGTGALPLLRHIILNDDKASTYKLALLRAISRIADSAAGYARDANEDHVAVPLGLVGLYWVRLFKPLLAANLPQSPRNRGDSWLGFVKERGFRRLQDVSYLDLRIGMTFTGERSVALHHAIRDACRTIAEMPARYTTYPNGVPILPITRGGPVLRSETLRLEDDYLSEYGDLLIPRDLWRALQRYDVWIEPALVAEWVRLMKAYADSQGRPLDEGAVVKAMEWSEPSRDVRIAREQALALIESSTLECVWSGRRLSANTLDIDHCLPWAVWPCSDLWNLLPAHQNVNKEKRDRLPSRTIIQRARDAIERWWDVGYLRSGNPVLPERFVTEARASLPTINASEIKLEDIFAGLELRRLRLKHDQQVPVWEPSGGLANFGA